MSEVQKAKKWVRRGMALCAVIALMGYCSAQMGFNNYQMSGGVGGRGAVMAADIALGLDPQFQEKAIFLLDKEQWDRPACKAYYRGEVLDVPLVGCMQIRPGGDAYSGAYSDVCNAWIMEDCASVSAGTNALTRTDILRAQIKALSNPCEFLPSPEEVEVAKKRVERPRYFYYVYQDAKVHGNTGMWQTYSEEWEALECDLPPEKRSKRKIVVDVHDEHLTSQFTVVINPK